MIMMGVFVIITVTMINDHDQSSYTAELVEIAKENLRLSKHHKTLDLDLEIVNITTLPMDLDMCYNYDCHGPWWHDHIIMIMIPSSTVP